MRILILTQYYYPETFKSTDIGEELVKRGHHVDALVGIPNYPEGEYYKGYGVFARRHENVNGVNVYRCFQTPRGKNATAIGLSFNYLTFVISATLWVIFYFAWKKRYDAIITHEPSPITQIIPAIILSKLRNIPVYSWILDIWPDSLVSAIGEKKSKYVKSILACITEWIYENSQLILVSSKGMMNLVNRNHDYSNKLVYFPNWCDDILAMPIEKTVKLPSGFKIMMAGNLNSGIGVESVIELVAKLRDLENVCFVFVGGGAKEKELKDKFERLELKNVVMTGRLPFSQMPALYSQADAMLISLLKTNLPHLQATVPARLQSYMAAGKPILGMIDGCSREIINNGDCGFASHAGDSDVLADYIRNIIVNNPESFKLKGENSRNFYEKYYQKNNCISNLEFYLKGNGLVNPPFEVPEL